MRDINVQTAAPAVFPVNIRELAREHDSLKYTQLLNYVDDIDGLKGNDKILYGKLLYKANGRGYIEGFTREKLADEFKFSLSSYKRALGQLVEKNLVISLFRGNGDANILVLPAHPDMNLPENKLVERRIELPKHVQALLNRAVRRRDQKKDRSQNFKDQLSDQASDQDRSDLRSDLKKSAGSESTGSKTSHLTDSAGSDLSRPKENNDHVIIFKDHGLAMPWPITITIVDVQKQREQFLTNNISTKQATIQSSEACSDLRDQLPKMAEQRNNKNRQEDSESNPVKKSAKPKARSRYPKELWIRYAISEQARKNSIDSIEAFAEARYALGNKDFELDKWLQEQSRMQTGKYQSSVNKPEVPQISIPSPSFNPQITEEEIKKSMQLQTSDTTSILPSNSSDIRIQKEIAYQLDLEQRRSTAINSLSETEREQRIASKITELKASERWLQYKRMAPEVLLEQVKYEIQRELVLA